MDLSEATGNFLQALEGHNELYPEAVATLIETISKATLAEIIDEYNVNSTQKLWTEDLIEIYYDEILKRFHEEVNFTISTCWKNAKDWKPYFRIQMTLSQTQYILDCDGIPLSKNSNTKVKYVKTGDFSQENNEKILSAMAMNNDIHVVGELFPDDIKIVGIVENNKNPVLFFYNKIDKLKKKEGGKHVDAKAIITKEYEVSVMQRMLQGLASNNPSAIDIQKEMKTSETIREKEQLKKRKEEEKEFKLISKL